MYGRAKQGVYVLWRLDFVYILIFILQRTVSEAFYAGIRGSHLFNLMICDNINNGNRTLYLRFFNGIGGCLMLSLFFSFFIFHFLFFGGVVKRHGRSKITLRGVENKKQQQIKTKERKN